SRSGGYPARRKSDGRWLAWQWRARRQSRWVRRRDSGSRTLAYIIDAIIVGIVTGVLVGILRLDPATSGNGLGLLINLVYFAVLWSSTGGGQTLGMRILNLKVICTDGSDLSIVQGVIRWVGL